VPVAIEAAVATKWALRHLQPPCSDSDLDQRSNAPQRQRRGRQNNGDRTVGGDPVSTLSRLTGLCARMSRVVAGGHDTWVVKDEHETTALIRQDLRDMRLAFSTGGAGAESSTTR
jgi:hypothetical protein